MRAMVLGGTGFIGSHLVDRLLAAGHQVRVFSRSPERFRAPVVGVDYRQAELADQPALVAALTGVEVVYHLISTTVPATSNRDPVYDIESNLVGMVRLLQAIRDSGVRRLVYLSSGGTVYGSPQVLPIPEGHPLHPICSYGIVKVAAENYLHMFQQLHGLEYLVLRASNPYGERQGHYGVLGVIGTFLHKLRSGEALEVWGDGSLVRDFLHVDDLARLCVQAGSSDRQGIYNAGSGRGYSIREVLACIAQVVGRELPVTWREGRSFDVPQVVLDVAKAEADFAWHPEIELVDGISRTWEGLKPSPAESAA
ncbi:MAG: NAD-dependent epimerase/dehydratase family protein [Desulfobulbaceae bacterium]|nr:NAD-dependent epimerase/dehydratase family protein [Desulfobulbaceae bacterium]